MSSAGVCQLVNALKGSDSLHAIPAQSTVQEPPVLGGGRGAYNTIYQTVLGVMQKTLA